MQRGRVIEKTPARIAGRGAVKISIRGLDEAGGMSALAILESENGRERSRRRNPEDHSVEVTHGSRRGRAVEVAIAGCDEEGRIRFALGGRLEIVEVREDAILSEPQNGTVTGAAVEVAKVRGVKRPIGKPDLREGGERLGEGS